MTEALAQFRLVDLIDILIVTFAIYQLFLILRGTRAIEMILGLALLYLASRVSHRLGLLTVNWALQNLLGISVLVIIVIFQPEIRRTLAKVGRRSAILRAFSRLQEAHTIDELVRAAVELSSKKVGALIVIERDTRLSDYVVMGGNVDAAISWRLLEAIFTPPSPLHDGAVLVQGDRIAYAGCFLPLTLNPYLSKEMGTRHRAAIGITEETDAVAVVVSEKTRTISVAAHGEMIRGLDATTLRERLEEVLAPAKIHRKGNVAGPVQEVAQGRR
ncbi:MAG: diadenylate cyclase CdaA [Candidatus Methylomirabilales bacterium]